MTDENNHTQQKSVPEDTEEHKGVYAKAFEDEQRADFDLRKAVAQRAGAL